MAAGAATDARTISVKVFGPQARRAGADAVAVSVPPGATAGEVRAAVGEACPPLRPSLAGSRLAVDHAYATHGEAVPDGAEVALIGLVSGG